MKTDINNLAAEFEAANFFDKIPAQIEGFTLKKILLADGDKFNYFTYENISTHRSLTAYFHEETKEYKVRVKLGLTEFCLTNFFTSNFEHFTKTLTAELEHALKNLAAQVDADSDILISDKKFSTWTYGQNLPQNLEGFELFIAPKFPVRITNGSYIIINYSNFENNVDFNILYNVYGDNFSGESQIGGVHHPSYIFDATNLTELEKILVENLSTELCRIKNISAV